MKAIIPATTLEAIQTYIETTENVKLRCRSHFFDARKDGRPPHYDYGYDRFGKPDYHMAWCVYSASVLLTRNYDGGEFVFLDDENNEIEVIDKHKHFNHALVFDVSHKHKVNPHSNGERKVELFFFEKVED